jgi:hypothetical protein
VLVSGFSSSLDEAVREHKIPTGLISADVLVEKLVKFQCHVTKQRILDLAESGYLPCWRWHHGGEPSEPCFHYGEIREWIAENWLERQDGLPFPKKLAICKTGHLGEPPSPYDVPTALSPIIEHLRQLTGTLCGIYFFCYKSRVVYVGQSQNVAVRVASHTDKLQDHVFYLPVPPAELDDVESAFIRALNPPYNGNEGVGARDNGALALERNAPEFDPTAVGSPPPPPSHKRSFKKLEGAKEKVDCWHCHERYERSGLLAWSPDKSQQVQQGRCVVCDAVLIEAHDSAPRDYYHTLRVY